MSYFISLDGMDGAGKSTQLQFIEAWYAEKRLPVYLTREIGGTELGERLRDLILNPEHDWEPDSELLLIFAARKQHVERRIKPLLAQGISVVCDRFNDATYAYQGLRLGADAEARIAALERWALGDFRPDLSFILLLDEAEALQRRQQRQKAQDIMELQAPRFHQQLAAIYHQRSRLPHHAAINANATAETVWADIRQHLEALYAL